MNEGLGIFFDQFGNPIDNLIGGQGPTFPDNVPSIPAPQDIAISEGARVLTDAINSGVGIDIVNQGEGEQFIREGILAGNPGVIQDIVANKINTLDDSAKGAIASQAFGVFNPALAQLAAANQVNQGIQVAGDFVQGGIGALQNRMDPEGFGFGALDKTSNIIEGAQNISGDVVGSANIIVGDLIYNPLGQLIGRVNQGIINPLFNPIQDFGLNLIGRGRRETDDQFDSLTVDPGQGIVINQAQDGGGTGSGQLSNSDINQIMAGQEPSSVTFQGGGGSDRGGDVSTPGTVVVGSSFTPPSTNVQQETNRIRDILDRRAQGSSQGFNAGGLATIPRYLKGR
jgi:hypothetical protein